ncbi:hypothetical protein [Methylobacterium radiotolerans]|uniref:hypothetical protein n=1 Tax=Methylobacterium radiotolerans TaxID=31998 RepID=UPI0009778F69|nr:hypothetical protein [Methylobacterium radiotolerans]ONF47785.1 hypothetical protein RSM1_17675 [Methylobacterium radiotolerans]
MFDPAVRGCFGETDLIFAGHPNDEERAFQWLADLRKRSVGWKAARAQVVEYLESRGASASHVQQQTEKVRRLFKPWLLD